MPSLAGSSQPSATLHHRVIQTIHDRVNAKGVFFCLQRVAREMIPRRSGRIINIASIAGKGYAGASNATYAASKGA